MITLWNRNDHLGHDGLEAGVACFRHQLAQMDEVHALAERCCLEEIERLKVPHELHVRLGQRGVVQGLVLRRGVGEADLLGEDGLAGARGPGKDDERARLEPAPENQIEVRNPGSQPPHVSRRRLG